MVVDVDRLLADEERLAWFRHQAMTDTGFVAREVMGFDYDLDHASKKVKRRINEGTGGVRANGPHLESTRFLDNDDPFSIMLEPRGTYKSSKAEARCLRAIIQDPNAKVAYLMKTETQAIKKSIALRSHFEKNPIVQRVFGLGRGPVWGTKGWTVSGCTDYADDNPTFQVGSIKKPITGGHPNLIIVDDLIDFENCRTGEQLELAQLAIDMVIPLRTPGGKVIDIGTRYDPADMHSYCEGKGWPRHIRGCGFQLVRSEVTGDFDLVGEALFPNLTREFLLEQLRGMTIEHFCSQYLNEHLVQSASVFRREWFRPHPWRPDMAHLSGWLVCDCATSRKKTSAMTALIYVLMDQNRNYFMADAVVGRMEPAKTIDAIFRLCAKWSDKCNHRGITMENVALHEAFKGGIQLEQLHRGQRIHVREVPRGSAEHTKEARIRRMEPVLRNGRIWVLDTFPRLFHDGRKERVLWDPVGYTEPNSGARMPGGELVDQFVNFRDDGPYPKDIPDALADLEHILKTGEYVCYFSQPNVHRVIQSIGAERQQPLDQTPPPTQDWFSRLGTAPTR